MYDKINGKPTTHLGDGVYASYDGTGIRLRANDHRYEFATDEIYLEQFVIRALNMFHSQAVVEYENET